MAEAKTKPTGESVTAFLDKISNEQRRADCFTVLQIMKDVTKEKPQMWGPAMVGFGRYRYKYESGREGVSMLTGFSPRKGDLTLISLAVWTPFQRSLSGSANTNRERRASTLRNLMT